MRLSHIRSPLACFVAAVLVGSAFFPATVLAHQVLYNAHLRLLEGCTSHPDAGGNLLMQADEDTEVFDVLDLTVVGISPDQLDRTHGPNATAIHIHSGAHHGGSEGPGGLLIDLGWYIDAGFGTLTPTADGFQVTISGVLTAVQGAYDMTGTTGLTPHDVIHEMEEGNTSIFVHTTDCPGGALSGHLHPDIEAVEVTVDIDPGTCPTVVKAHGDGGHGEDEDDDHGVSRQFRVAILGSPELDATQVDLASLHLAGVHATFAWVRDRFKPDCGRCRYNRQDLSESCTVSCARRDGHKDVIAFFDRDEVIAALHAHDAEPGHPVEVELEGELLDGTHIAGHDCVIFAEPRDHDHDDDDGRHGTPGTAALGGAIPNPFNPVTRISYQVFATTDVRLAVYDVNGRLVKQLVAGTKNPGSYDVEWDASNMASGIYFYRLEVQNATETKKMILLK